MKTLLRAYTFELVALWIAQSIFGESFQIRGGWENLFLVGLLLAAFEMTLKPILKLLFFPINMASMGLFSIVLTAGSLYGLQYFQSDLHIEAYTFPGFGLMNVHIPSQNLGFIGTLIAIAFVLTLINKFLHYLVD